MLIHAIIQMSNKLKTKMPKTKKFSKTQSILRTASVIGVFGVFVFASVYVPTARADRFDDQIRALDAESEKKEDRQDQLAVQAGGIAQVIRKLQGEINAMQSKINANEAKVADLQQQIKEAEAELARQRVLLGQTIRAMYVEGDITTVEMLATSKDLSDFFDKQQYRESVRSKVKKSLDNINRLKLELKGQKESVEKLLADQKELQSKLSARRAENNRLLSMNKAQQNALDAQIRANSSKIAELRRQQAAENARLFANSAVRYIPDGSGYPWANYRAGSWTHEASCTYGDDIDPWGMCYRQCVSYAAWKVYKTHGYDINYWGDAKNWDNRAASAGLTVNGTPRAGTVAVSDAGTWGHVMFVESVNGNGTINISQYNVSLTGTYSEATISASGLKFIHF